MDYYSVLVDNLSLYFTSDVLTIIIALLALLITFIAVSIPTMILATADFQKSFFDTIMNSECIKVIKKEELTFEIRELSNRNIKNSLFMNFVYRMTWWYSVLALVLTLATCVIIPAMALDKKYCTCLAG